jgi:Leucine-rich repeat (LRR) protein
LRQKEKQRATSWRQVGDGLNLDQFKIFPNMKQLYTENYFFPSLILSDSLLSTNLISVVIWSASLTTFKSTATKDLELEELSLCFNEITVIEKGTFDKMPKLKRLDLTWNKMTSIDANTFKPLKALQRIKLSKNLIKSGQNIFQAIPPSVSMIYFAEAEIIRLPIEAFKTLPNLKLLNLDGNKLTYFVAKTLGLGESLTELSLESNQLISFSGNGIKNCTTLNLDKNKLTKIVNDMFEKNIVFDSISFSENQVSKIEKSFMERQNVLQTSQYSKNPCITPGPTEDKQMMMENMENCFPNLRSLATTRSAYQFSTII